MVAAAPPPSAPSALVSPLIPAFSYVILFCLVACLAATVDMTHAYARGPKLWRGVAVAMAMQFVLLPLVGFLTTRAFNMGQIEGVMLMVVVSSPGGAYSNWWCSLFNADLILSVAATACSTLLAALLLPLNLLIYLSASYGSEMVGMLRWDLLLLSIGVVTAAVATGLVASRRISRMARDERVEGLGMEGGGPGRAVMIRARFGHAGNLFGLVLIIFSVVFSSVDEPIWDKPSHFYIEVALPAIVSLVLSSLLTTLPCLRLTRPERVAVTIECLYQNTGIATSIALSVFSGADASRAAGTPLYYGVCQTVLIPLYVLSAWQLGWTYAPRTDPLWKVVRDNYQRREPTPPSTPPQDVMRELAVALDGDRSPEDEA